MTFPVQDVEGKYCYYCQQFVNIPVSIPLFQGRYKNYFGECRLYGCKLDYGAACKDYVKKGN